MPVESSNLHQPKTLPATWMRDEDIFQLEKRAIFSKVVWCHSVFHSALFGPEPSNRPGCWHPMLRDSRSQETTLAVKRDITSSLNDDELTLSVGSYIFDFFIILFEIL